MVRLPQTALALALALTAGSAQAYVRSRTAGGTAVFWNDSCAFLQLDSAGAMDLPFATVQQIVTKSIANWQSVTFDAGCSYLKIEQDAPAPIEATLDYLNAIKFRADKWCRPADAAEKEVCYSPQAAAITTVFYTTDPGKPDDGAILDADIQLNQLNFTFVWVNNLVPPIRDGTQQSDLENTLTHELGHFQGLDHTCWDHLTTNPPVDDQGNPIPDCNNLDSLPPAEKQQIVQATMFNFATAGETIKRMPKMDDINGICQGAAPISKDPKNCAHPKQKGSCAVGGAGAVAWPLALLLLALVVRRRSVYR